jgi:hypothetical protein
MRPLGHPDKPKKLGRMPCTTKLPPVKLDVTMLDVLIASPGDASSGRDTAERALHDWNDHRSETEGIILRPRLWEVASVPIQGRGDAQSVINSQLVDESDIVIAIFYGRLGTATPRDISGTAEEVNRSVAAGKLVHLLFAEKDLPHNADLEQVKALRDFKSKVQDQGLIRSFKNEAELSRLVDRIIEHDVRELTRHRPTESGEPGKLVPKQEPPVEPAEQRSSEASDAGDVSVGKSPPIHILNGADSTSHEVIERPGGILERFSGHFPFGSLSREVSVSRVRLLSGMLLGITLFGLFGFLFGWLAGIDQRTPTSTPSTTASPMNVYLINLLWSTEPAEDRPKVQPGFAIIKPQQYSNSLTLVGCETIRIDFDFGSGRYTNFTSLLQIQPKSEWKSKEDPSMPVKIYVRDEAAATSDWILKDSFPVIGTKALPFEMTLPPTATDLRLVTEAPCSTVGVWGDPVLKR